MPHNPFPPGIIIGAPRSGAGKTSATLGLIVALRRRGLNVCGFKSGPDYIDPAFHAAASGRSGLNLDSWAMAPNVLVSLAYETGRDSDFVVIESAMGLFDGIPAGPRRTGSAADLAALFGVPVLLVLDVSGQSQTAAAVARGFATHDPDVRIAGVILNRVASGRHKALASAAIEEAGLPVVGSIFRDPTLTLPERHLGLVQALEHPELRRHLDRLGDMAEHSLDLDAILRLASPLALSASDPVVALDPPGQRIALAWDESFTFVYPHVIAGWQRAGAEICRFSPLADQSPPEDCDVCWLPGGYPELHAGIISSAAGFRRGMEVFARTRPIHGECGGFMVLGDALEDAQGTKHPMLGLLGHMTSFAKRKMNLGYREAKLRTGSILGAAGASLRGHEFHYASFTETGADEKLVDLSDGQGRAIGPSGGRRGNVTGTFFHAISKAS
jgi:cobyrinic acid a,c-diamide synthase